MAYIVKDTNPQYGGQCYFIGTRKIKDPHGRDCEAADFGDKENAVKFRTSSEANSRAEHLNKIAGARQFIVEELSIYGQQYGRRNSNGFAGFGTLPEPGVHQHGGFIWNDGNSNGGYNGF